MTEESIYLIEEFYLQETKDKEFQLKQQLQSIKLGSRTTDEYLKEFKDIYDCLSSIHKHADEDNKIINFTRGLSPKYKTFRIVMLGKAPSLNQFVNAIR